MPGTLPKKLRLEAQGRIANAILQSTDDAVISKSLHGIITSWNPGATRIFGYTEAEMLGRSIQTLPPPDLKNEEDFILERFRKGETIDH